MGDISLSLVLRPFDYLVRFQGSELSLSVGWFPNDYDSSFLDSSLGSCKSKVKFVKIENEKILEIGYITDKHANLFENCDNKKDFKKSIINLVSKYLDCNFSYIDYPIDSKSLTSSGFCVRLFRDLGFNVTVPGRVIGYTKKIVIPSADKYLIADMYKHITTQSEYYQTIDDNNYCVLFIDGDLFKLSDTSIIERDISYDGVIDYEDDDMVPQSPYYETRYTYSTSHTHDIEDDISTSEFLESKTSSDQTEYSGYSDKVDNNDTVSNSADVDISSVTGNIDQIKPNNIDIASSDGQRNVRAKLQEIGQSMHSYKIDPSKIRSRLLNTLANPNDSTDENPINSLVINFPVQYANGSLSIALIAGLLFFALVVILILVLIPYKKK